MNRRKFIVSVTSGTIATLAIIKKGIPFAENTHSVNDLIKVMNGEPEALVKASLQALGGMKRFVSAGEVVVVKPNIGWDRNPQQGANTHPQIVAVVVRECLNAGAKEVLVFDNSCNSAERCYQNSGIALAAKEAGAKVTYIMKNLFRDIKIPEGMALKKWQFYKPALEADKYINLPVLKQHSMATLTIGIKNIMGVIGGNRGSIHNDFERKIVDLNSVIRPTLTIVDATRVLRRNGPVGGNLKDVDPMRQVIAGIDPVAVEAVAAEVFGIPYKQLGYIMLSESRGLGSLKNLSALKIINLQN